MVIIKIIRRTIGFPFLLIGILFFYLAEIISGEKFTWRGDMVRRETMILQNRKEMLKQQMFNSNGFRKPKKRRR